VEVEGVNEQQRDLPPNANKNEGCEERNIKTLFFSPFLSLFFLMSSKNQMNRESTKEIK